MNLKKIVAGAFLLFACATNYAAQAAFDFKNADLQAIENHLERELRKLNIFSLSDDTIPQQEDALKKILNKQLPIDGDAVDCIIKKMNQNPSQAPLPKTRDALLLWVMQQKDCIWQMSFEFAYIRNDRTGVLSPPQNDRRLYKDVLEYIVRGRNSRDERRAVQVLTPYEAHEKDKNAAWRDYFFGRDVQFRNENIRVHLSESKKKKGENVHFVDLEQNNGGGAADDADGFEGGNGSEKIDNNRLFQLLETPVWRLTGVEIRAILAEKDKSKKKYKVLLSWLKNQIGIRIASFELRASQYESLQEKETREQQAEEDKVLRMQVVRYLIDNSTLEERSNLQKEIIPFIIKNKKTQWAFVLLGTDAAGLEEALQPQPVASGGDIHGQPQQQKEQEQELRPQGNNGGLLGWISQHRLVAGAAALGVFELAHAVHRRGNLRQMARDWQNAFRAGSAAVAALLPRETNMQRLGQG